MKMKKNLLMLIVCLCAISMTSCEEDTILIYYPSIGDTSVNYSSNTVLKTLVSNAIKGSDGTVEKFNGTESEAIEWFDSMCSEISDPSFIEGVVVSDETWMELKLIESSSLEAVKTTRITFAD